MMTETGNQFSVTRVASKSAGWRKTNFLSLPTNPNPPQRLAVDNFGPIKKADVTFGDLTVFVGPQATGKSILLQLAKLIIDRGAVQARLKHYGIDWRGKPEALLEAYFGEGMANLNSASTKISWNGEAVSFAGLARKGNLNEDEQVFFIPAQRVMAFHATNGWLRGWSDFRDGDPFVVRDFGAELHALAQEEFTESGTVFPKTRRFKTAIRQQLDEAIFGGFELRLEQKGLQRRFVLARGKEDSLPLTVWSAGQREFVPPVAGRLPFAASGGRGPTGAFALGGLRGVGDGPASQGHLGGFPAHPRFAQPWLPCLPVHPFNAHSRHSLGSSRIPPAWWIATRRARSVQFAFQSRN